jgi:hypothetical protein
VKCGLELRFEMSYGVCGVSEVSATRHPVEVVHSLAGSLGHCLGTLKPRILTAKFVVLFNVLVSVLTNSHRFMR